MIYEYPGQTFEPNLTKILDDVGLSNMTNKNIEWCRWDQDISLIVIAFTNPLDAQDKSKLDVIVANS